LLAKGEIPQAQIVITNALRQDRWDLRVRWLAHEVFLSGCQTHLAEEMADGIIRAVTSHPRDYRDAPSLTIFGQAALAKGADPKRVLDTDFEAAKKADPKERAVYLATGNLALEKHDHALAAKRFEEGLK